VANPIFDPIFSPVAAFGAAFADKIIPTREFGQSPYGGVTARRFAVQRCRPVMNATHPQAAPVWRIS